MCPKLRIICSRDKYCEEAGQRRGFANLRNKEEAEMELSYLKKVMKKYHGNRALAADSLQIHLSLFRRALARFKEVDWAKEFPLTYTRTPKRNSMDSPESRAKLSKTLKEMGHRPPPNKKGTKQYKKWLKTITPTLKAKKESLHKRWKERLIQALRENQHKRAETAASLEISAGHLLRLINRFAKEDEGFRKEFRSPEISMRLKRASCLQTQKKTRLKFIRDNKHLILQAYYQNDETDYKAAKILKVDTRTFTRWREEIEEDSL